MQYCLTENMIMKKYPNITNIGDIKCLNLWGCDIEDISILQRLENIEIITLSVNNIKSLDSLSKCHKIRELYIRKNLIEDLNQLKNLKECKDLKLIWIEDNPCTRIENYRLHIIKILPQLTKLDNIIITTEEREQADKMFSQNKLTLRLPKRIHSFKLNVPSSQEALDKYINMKKVNDIFKTIDNLLESLNDNHLRHVKFLIEKRLSK
jgi:hypothetical protein